MEPQHRPLLAQPYQSLLALPLIVQHEVYAAVVLYYARAQRPRQFSDYDPHLALALAEQGSLAIENSRLRAQAQQSAASLLAAERNRLAPELHEQVKQALFSSSIIADILPQLYERNPEEGRKRLVELRDAVKGALSEMRVLLLELRPRALAETRLGDLLQELANALGGRIRVPVHLTVEGDRPLPLNVRIAFYRIAQEALSNIAHHANASHVTIRLRLLPDMAEMTISDNGRGFDAKSAASASAGERGLETMRARARAIGGKLRVESRADSGASVTIVWHDPHGRSSAN